MIYQFHRGDLVFDVEADTPEEAVDIVNSNIKVFSAPLKDRGPITNIVLAVLQVNKEDIRAVINPTPIGRFFSRWR